MIAVTAVAGFAGGGVANATTIGSDLTLSPTAGLGDDNSGVQTVAPIAALNPLTSPANGVLVRIRLRYGTTDANPGSIGFRIMGGTGPFAARPATVDGGELRFPLLANLGAGSDDFVDYRPVDSSGRPIGIPIAAGERLGVAQQKTGSARVAALAAGATVAFAAGQSLSGTIAFTDAPGFELAVQGSVEPDADGDLRGDETQDQCPTVKNDPTTGLCPPQLVTREIPIEVRKCHVPLLRGLSRTLAERLLAASGCVLGQVSTRAVRRGPRGRVVRQSVRANAVLDSGASVGITLSKRAAARHRR